MDEELDKLRIELKRAKEDYLTLNQLKNTRTLAFEDELSKLQSLTDYLKKKSLRKEFDIDVENIASLISVNEAKQRELLVSIKECCDEFETQAVWRDPITGREWPAATWQDHFLINFTIIGTALTLAASPLYWRRIWRVSRAAYLVRGHQRGFLTKQQAHTMATRLYEIVPESAIENPFSADWRPWVFEASVMSTCFVLWGGWLVKQWRRPARPTSQRDEQKKLYYRIHHKTLGSGKQV